MTKEEYVWWNGQHHGDGFQATHDPQYGLRLLWLALATTVINVDLFWNLFCSLRPLRYCVLNYRIAKTSLFFNSVKFLWDITQFPVSLVHHVTVSVSCLWAIFIKISRIIKKLIASLQEKGQCPNTGILYNKATCLCICLYVPPFCKRLTNRFT